MITIKISTKAALLMLFALVFLASTVVFAAGRPAGSIGNAGQPLADENVPAPAFSTQPPANPASLSPSLSYYFISGNTFTAPGGSVPYSRQVTGCVNQMPLGANFSAPVHLPQNSEVISITLYTYDSAITTTYSTASFIIDNGMGGAGSGLSADSQANQSGYQHHDSTQDNPWTIDNQNYNYTVSWYTHSPVSRGSPLLSLCGVRVIYHAPLGVAAYLPAVMKQ